MRWDNLLLVKYSDLHTLSNVSTWSRFTHFLVFWLDLAIYALCRILMKCRDLRIFPGTNYRFPGTKNFSSVTNSSDGLIFVKIRAESGFIRASDLVALPGVWKSFWCLGTNNLCLEICVNRDISSKCNIAHQI